MVVSLFLCEVSEEAHIFLCEKLVQKMQLGTVRYRGRNLFEAEVFSKFQVCLSLSYTSAWNRLRPDTRLAPLWFSHSNLN